MQSDSDLSPAQVQISYLIPSNRPKDIFLGILLTIIVAPVIFWYSLNFVESIPFTNGSDYDGLFLYFGLSLCPVLLFSIISILYFFKNGKKYIGIGIILASFILIFVMPYFVFFGFSHINSLFR